MEKAAEKIASFDDLLASTEVEYANVTVDGKTYRIGSITGEEFVAWQEMRDSGLPDAKKNASAVLISRSLVDAEGKRIGDETKAGQIKKLKLKTSEALLKAIFRLNDINQPAEARAKNA